ncbi:YdcF family protein [Mesorhizobium sp. BAC0120]|nr:YdcF family protein [Mesorhizobium sp. BAC0120]MDW6026098.1 YdcF family protein [Mesorhizobium sp. BAC0120]
MAMKGQDFPLSANGRPGKGNSFSQSAWRLRTVNTVKYAAIILSLLCVSFLGGFALFADHVGSLAAPKDMAAADAIIVLTGGQSRIDAALDLLKSGKGERLLISGVNPTASREALRAATGADRQLFRCCVDIDNAALDTIGNAEESAKWVEAHAYQSIILVTNNYHMPRSLLEMHRLLQKARLEPYPVVNSRLDNGGWMGKPDAIRVLLTEYTKYLAAILRGLVQPPNAKPGNLTVVDAAVAAGG